MLEGRRRRVKNLLDSNRRFTEVISWNSSNAAHHPPRGPVETGDSSRVRGQVYALVRRSLKLKSCFRYA